jgi:integrase
LFADKYIPVVIVKADRSKAKKEDVIQPLRAQLTMLLKDFFKNKMPDTKAFGGRYDKLTDKTADMVRFDLANTAVMDGDKVLMEAIPYKTSNGFADFHSLRSAFVTNLTRKAPGRVVQKLARHADSKMTDRYAHPDLNDKIEAVKTLPDLSLPPAKVRLTKEGTNG